MPDPTGGPRPPEPPGTPEPPGPSTEPAELDLDAVSFEADTVPRDYAERLKAEAIKHRGRYKEIRDRFEPVKDADPQALAQARALYDALGTKDGQRQAFLELAGSLGLADPTVRTLEQILDGRTATEDDTELDAPLTKRELATLLDQFFNDRVRPDLAAATEEVAYDRIRRTLDATRTELGITDDRTWRQLLAIGDSFLSEDESNPATFADAVRKAHAEWEEVLNSRQQSLLTSKAATNDGAPSPLTGGSSPAGETPAEPANSREAGKFLRERLRAGR